MLTNVVCFAFEVWLYFRHCGELCETLQIQLHMLHLESWENLEVPADEC